jgi:hypothetical protein
MSPESLLAALRSGSTATEQARAALADIPGTGDSREHDARAEVRAAVSALLAASLQPSDAPLTRWLLEQEIALHMARGHGASETLYTLVAAVARFGDPADALLLWRARAATAETRAGVDVEQLARAGVQPVERHLRRLAQGTDAQAEQAREALRWLEDGRAAGALDDLPAYFAWADERYGLHISGLT